MDHESMNLWDAPEVVKAFAEAAIRRFRNTTWRDVVAYVKQVILGAFAAITYNTKGVK